MQYFINEIKAENEEIFIRQGSRPLASVKIYGCQQNLADGDRLRGLLTEMGFELTDNAEDAGVVIVNTCAVREHAEKKVLSQLGTIKRRRVLAVCGCMAQQEHIRQKIKNSYPQVNLMFGPAMIPRLPEMLFEVMSGGGRRFFAGDPTAPFEEWVPAYRDPPPRAWVTVMTGCNNFCSYCIVPYVRGRERSRAPEEILREVRGLISDGYSEIFLLGQNVNSYAPESPEIPDFSSLLRAINSLEGDFKIRFMTSHPKDATKQLFDTMAECEKVSKILHLPFQAGSDSVLEAMNRKYTAGQYIALTDYAKSVMPGLKLTSDVIVGFPGETERDFQQTLELMKRVRFESLFTFIYSKRGGTPAADMPDTVPAEEIKRRMAALLALQKEIDTNGDSYDAAIYENKGAKS